MGQAELLDRILPRLRVVSGPDRNGDHTCWCEFHPDGQGQPPHEPNLKVGPKGFICHACDAKGGLHLLAAKLGIESNPTPHGPSNGSAIHWYDYVDESGELLYQVGRKQPKGFTQRHPDGNGGWSWSLNGTRRVIYRLPELISRPDETVYIVEGEKDADRLCALGLLATTNSGGAGKWRAEFSEFLRDRDVVILPDNDDPGRKHADQVLASLAGIARSAKVVNLPGLPTKGDVSDWLGAGHTADELQALVAGEESEPTVVALPLTLMELGDDPHRLAAAFVSRHCTDGRGALTLRHWRHQWWRWSGTHYRSIDRDELRAILAAFLKEELDRWCRVKTPDKPPKKVTHQLVSNVVQALSGLVLVSFDHEQPIWIGGTVNEQSFLSMANGLLDVERFLAGESPYLRDHSPEWFSSHHLPYDFDPLAGCPKWLSFLEEVLEGDQQRINLLQEWFGYCLLSDTSRQKFLVLEGEGANGKSVVCGILADVLGHRNVSHVPLERFGDRFQLTMTLGKLANIASEVGDLDKAAEGVLKAFTAGDRMSFDRKGVPGLEAFPTARLVLATNNRPRFSDRSSGLWRRMLLIPFRITIPEAKQDPRLQAKLQKELPGIFNWAIAGLYRLRAAGKFTESKLGREAVEEYQIENNPARLFLLEACTDDPNDEVACSHLYKLYSDWAAVNGYRPLGERMFGKEVVRVFPKASRVRKGTRLQREYQYQGVTVSQVP